VYPAAECDVPVHLAIEAHRVGVLDLSIVGVGGAEQEDDRITLGDRAAR
jgi:hypothetical protein